MRTKSCGPLKWEDGSDLSSHLDYGTDEILRAQIAPLFFGIGRDRWRSRDAPKFRQRASCNRGLHRTTSRLKGTVLTYGVELNLPRRFQPFEMLVSGKNRQPISPCRGSDNSVRQLHPIFLSGLYNELRKDWVVRWDVENIGASSE